MVKKLELMRKVQHFLSSDEVPQILPPKGGSIQDVMALTYAMGGAIWNTMQQSMRNKPLSLAGQAFVRFMIQFLIGCLKHLLTFAVRIT